MIVTIQSANRSQNVSKIEEALGDIEPLWFVPEKCAEDYHKAGAKNIVPVVCDFPTKPSKTKQLNEALEYGYKSNDIVVTMDDDYHSSFEVFHEEDKKKKRNKPLHELIKEMTCRLQKSQYNLAGIDMTTNLFFKNNVYQEHGMVSGQILFHKPNKIRFDEKLDFLEDLDYVINHHINYGGILRYNYYVIDFHIFGRSEKENLKYEGGYKEFRNLNKQTEILKYISTKYSHPYVQFPEETEVGKSVHGKIKWKKLKIENSLENFMV